MRKSSASSGPIDADVPETVRRVLVEQLGVNAEEVTTHAALAADLGMDSLDRVEIAMALENDFALDVQLDDHGADNWRVVKDIMDTLAVVQKK